MRRARHTLASVALTLIALAALGASPAAAAFGLEGFEVTFTDSEGNTVTQAGAHPFEMSTAFDVTTREEGSEIFPEGAPRDVIVTPPVGFAGNPTATPRCSGAEFAAIDRETSLPACSNAAAVGTAAVRVSQKQGLAPSEFVAPVYNLDPAPGSALKLGFVISNVPISLEAGLSESTPYRVIAPTTNISQALIFFGAELTLWGNPADALHNKYRGNCLDPTNPNHVVPGEPVSKGTCGISIPEKPFLTLPRTCNGPLTTTFAADSWLDPAARLPNGEPNLVDPNWVTGFDLSEEATGCSKIGFAPEISTLPTNQSAESPTGLDVDVDVTDEGLTSPTANANKSDIKKAVVTLPPGMTINPSQAEGLGVCSEADLARETADSVAGAGCPNSSKIGTIEAETPLLEGTVLKGSLFVAKPYENLAEDSLIALYMVFRDRDLGIVVKQAGKVTPNPTTGQLVTTFDDLPQLPISHFHLHFREGGRSPLVTPPLCGSYTTTAEFTPWVRPTAAYTQTSTFTVSSGPGGGPCPAGGTPPFHPGYSAGTLNNAAGQYSPFYMRLTRNDGDQDITRFSSVLPPGVVGKLAGLTQCPQGQIEAAKLKPGLAEQAAPSCPLGSEIGRVLTGAGVGSELTYVPGRLYLAGPYNGAPLSVVAIVPAVAGPFDVGTVVVQVALNLNPYTAEVEVDGAASDPIPHILAGIPLKVRDLRVYVDRPDFILNPTSCEEEAARARIWGSGTDPIGPGDDLPVSVEDRFQAASCASLRFKPKLSLALKGGTKRNDHPALHSVLTYPKGPGYANIGKAVVTLPPSEFIDNAHINNPCTRVQFNAGACPKSSVLGTARAVTPLLDQPLEGPVYFRSNGGERLLPDIVADLRGQFRIVLVGFVDAKKARIRTTFASVPDAPVSKFNLDLFGGKRGLLVNSADLCAKKRRVTIRLTGQNGRRYNTQSPLKTSCGR